jgi:hypothetical protein
MTMMKMMMMTQLLMNQLGLLGHDARIVFDAWVVL